MSDRDTVADSKREKNTGNFDVGDDYIIHYTTTTTTTVTATATTTGKHDARDRRTTCVCVCVHVCVCVCGSWPGPVRARAFRPLIGWLRHRSPRYIRTLTVCVCVSRECWRVCACVRVCVCVWYPCTFGLTTNCPGRHFPHKTTPKH